MATAPPTNQLSGLVLSTSVPAALVLFDWQVKTQSQSRNATNPQIRSSETMDFGIFAWDMKIIASCFLHSLDYRGFFHMLYPLSLVAEWVCLISRCLMFPQPLPFTADHVEAVGPLRRVETSLSFLSWRFNLANYWQNMALSWQYTVNIIIIIVTISHNSVILTSPPTALSSSVSPQTLECRDVSYRNQTKKEKRPLEGDSDVWMKALTGENKCLFFSLLLPRSCIFLQCKGFSYVCLIYMSKHTFLMLISGAAVHLSPAECQYGKPLTRWLWMRDRACPWLDSSVLQSA